MRKITRLEKTKQLTKNSLIFVTQKSKIPREGVDEFGQGGEGRGEEIFSIVRVIFQLT